MSAVITFPEQAPRLAPVARYAEIAVYGTVGSITVTLARRTDAPTRQMG